MKIIDRPVCVETRKQKIPHTFVYGGQQRITQVADFWLESGEWWEGKPERAVYRVYTKGGGMFELYRNKGEKNWYLYKIYD